MDRPAAWRENAVDLEAERPFRVGGATVDPISRDTSYGNGHERLQPQTLKVLIALARRKGEVVTRSDLIDSCWGGRIVGEDVINRSISILRDFAERAGGFSIETIPKAGYRLVDTSGRAARANGPKLLAAGIALLATLAIVLFWTGRWQPWARSTSPGRELQVRLAGFSALSNGISPALLQSLQDETLAAFADDGAIGVTTSAASGRSRSGKYQMSGSVAREGAGLKVLLRIDNSESGASLWSRAFEYSAGEAARAPQLAALDLANMIRCGIGRSMTYTKPMPDETLRLIFASCENDGTINWQLDRAMDYARRVTIASPDFSAGWSGIAGIAVVLRQQKPPAEAAKIEAEAKRALDKALEIDGRNSEAWALRAYFLPSSQFLQRQEALKRAIASRPLDCGCEHHAYGLFLSQVGRLRDAEREFQRGVDIMHLNPGLYANLARAQFALGDRAKAMGTLRAARRVSRDSSGLDLLEAQFASGAGDPAKAMAILETPTLSANPDARLLAQSLGALESRDDRSIAQVRNSLLALTARAETNGYLPITLLARIGDTRSALAALQRLATTDPTTAYRTLFDPALVRAQEDDEFWAAASRLGLVPYWRASGQLPDICLSGSPPRQCSSLQ